MPQFEELLSIFKTNAVFIFSALKAAFFTGSKIKLDQCEELPDTSKVVEY